MRRKIYNQHSESDEWLRNHLSDKKYDELNSAIFRSVPQIYLQEMEGVCKNLIQNAKILGHIYETDGNHENDNIIDINISTEKLIMKDQKIPKKDISKMSDTDLYMSVVELEKAIKAQRRYNAKLLQEIQLLDPAMRQLDLEKQGLFVELMNIERTNPSP